MICDFGQVITQSGFKKRHPVKTKLNQKKLAPYAMEGRISVLNLSSVSPVTALPQENYTCRSLHSHYRVWGSAGEI